MPRKMLWLGSLILILLQTAVTSQRVSAATAMIFCNGNMASPSGLTPTQINGFRASGMNTMVIFTMGVATNGDFIYGGTLCSDGVYVGPSNWGALLAQCRVQPSSVNRIEMCIGSAGSASWTNIKNLIAANGNGSNTVLYRNLLALKNALGIDAIDNDDESAYDSASTIKFGQMCGAVGLKLTLCPYQNSGYWKTVKAGLGDICDAVYLQCYDGGAGQSPATWNTYFGGLKVIPGYWDNERDTTFLVNMQAWSMAGGNGGFLWPRDEGGNPPAGPGEMLQYAGWILTCYKPVLTPSTASEVIGGKVTFVLTYGGADNLSYQWQVIRNTTTNNIPGATNSTLTLSNLQLTNTAIYQVLASNVSGAVTSWPGSLTVGSPTTVNNLINSRAAQTGIAYGFPLTPSWTLAPGNIIYGRLPVATNGGFNQEAFGAGRNVSSLTAGDTLTISQPSGITSTNYLTAGNGTDGSGNPVGATVIYALTNTSAGGYNLTNITVYGGWFNSDRDQQAYTVYYSKMTAPTTFILLGTVNNNPVNAVTTVPSLTRVTLTAATGVLATNVAAVKFDFTSPASENGYCGYSEIGLFGIPLNPTLVVDTLPATAADVVGSQVSFTAGFSAANSMNYQWQKILGGTTNNVASGTNLILTLTNLQLTDTASYRLVVSNTSGMAVSSPRSLTVSSVPAAVNKIVTSYAAQTGLGSAVTNFTPTWNISPGSLIAGQSPSSVGGGSFSLYYAGVAPTLTDGAFGWLNYWPNVGSSPTEVTCGTVAGGAGQSVTYTLTGSANGYTLTSIVVYGGWGDAGRDQQAYTVYYSTAAAPGTFVALGSVNNNPANASGVQSATRATLTPVNGVLATNVVAVKFDFTTPVPENGYCGYSEIDIYGAPTVSTAPTTITARFSAGALALAWPLDHTGWRLQVQANQPTAGLTTNWVDVINATSTNQMVLPVTQGSGSVFYRLVYP